jgi:hypothetical protein
MASSASQMVLSPPHTWKRAPSANWPTFSMNITGLERRASVIRACSESVSAGCGATPAVAPTDAVTGPLRVKARTAMMLMAKIFAFMAELLLMV